MTGTAVNDAPTATNLSAAQTYTEDTPLALTAIVAADIDSANLTATLTLSNAGAGGLNTGTSGAVTSTYNAGSGVWSASGATADVNALLAALTFTPTANFNSSFTIATSVSDGSLAVTGSTAMTGTAVNDAPTIGNGTTVLLAGTDKSTTSSGTPSNAILASAAWVDVDTGALEGIAITAASGNGSWQYSTDGNTWNGFGAVSAGNALLITASTQVRYVPDGVNSETATFNFRAWDQTSGSASSNATPTYANPGAGGGTSAYSSQAATASIFISFANAAPVLDAAKTPAFDAVNEDAGAPVGAVGTLVSSLVDFALPAGQLDNVSDTDTGAVTGMAVTAADTANGSWWYSTDGGANWNALGAVSDANARLLAADASSRLYFQGNADFNGTLAGAITMRAWDRTAGSNGSLADTTTNGGGSAFSAATDTASLVVNVVNDAPLRTAGTVADLTVLEDAAATSLGLGAIAYGPGGGSDEAGQSLAYTVTAVPAGALGTITLADGITAVGLLHG